MCTYFKTGPVTKDAALAYAPFLFFLHYLQWGCRSTGDGSRWLSGNEPARAGLWPLSRAAASGILSDPQQRLELGLPVGVQFRLPEILRKWLGVGPVPLDPGVQPRAMVNAYRQLVGK